MTLALTALPRVLDQLRGSVADDGVEMFERLMRTNLTDVVRPCDDGTAFIITGDIPAMWLRDSSTQLRPYLLLADEDDELQSILVAVLRRQIAFLLTDPYANSFTDGSESWHRNDITDAGPRTWERKFELDSLCFPIELAHRLWRRTGRTDFFDPTFREACSTILTVFETEQHHETRSSYTFEREHVAPGQTLVRQGRGRRTEATGLIWSAFRPSDDVCDLGFNVPGNMFAAVALSYIEEIAVTHYADDALAERARKLRADIDGALRKHAIVPAPGSGKPMYAYEVDGLGHQLLMDDANMPSLLSAPLSGYVATNDPVYLATRAFVLSDANPYYFRGSVASGVGSPHTPHNYVWPIAIAVEALTCTDERDKHRALDVLVTTTAGTGRVHESFDADDADDFTRPWFSWADAMFCELALDLCGTRFAT